jgi:uncharacterized protein YaiI (UPF0178 family)
VQVWVDADACPAAIKEILYRAAERSEISVTLVANMPLRTPPSRFIRTVQVPRGLDVADKEIVQRVQADDLVVTADIPLAAEVVARGALALDPRGELYTSENIGEKLQMRNFMDQLRGSGVQTGGPAALDHADRKRFADRLDRLLRART